MKKENAFKIIMLPSNKKGLELNGLCQCIVKNKKGKPGPTFNSLGVAYDLSWFNIKKTYWEGRHLYVVSDGIPADDEDFVVCTAQEIRGRVFTEPELWCLSFIQKVNPTSSKWKKVIATSNPKLIAAGVEELDFKFLQNYAIAHNSGRPIKQVKIETVTLITPI